MATYHIYKSTRTARLCFRKSWVYQVGAGYSTAHHDRYVNLFEAIDL